MNISEAFSTEREDRVRVILSETEELELQHWLRESWGLYELLEALDKDEHKSDPKIYETVREVIDQMAVLCFEAGRRYQHQFSGDAPITVTLSGTALARFAEYLASAE